MGLRTGGAAGGWGETLQSCCSLGSLGTAPQLRHPRGAPGCSLGPTLWGSGGGGEGYRGEGRGVRGRGWGGRGEKG